MSDQEEGSGSGSWSPGPTPAEGEAALVQSQMQVASKCVPPIPQPELQNLATHVGDTVTADHQAV